MPQVSVTAVRPPGMNRQTTMSGMPYRSSERTAQARRRAPFSPPKNRRSTYGPKRRPSREQRLSPRNAPNAAHATSRAMRGSALPAVATPSAMTTVSLGSTGKTASRAGSTIATR